MILKILHHKVSKSRRDWHLQIKLTLWAYRTSIKTPIGTIPFSLVNGVDVVLPIEVEIPTLRISMKRLITDEDYKVS